MKFRTFCKKSSIIFTGMFLISAIFTTALYSQQGAKADTDKKTEEKKADTDKKADADKKTDQKKPQGVITSDKAKEGWQTTDYKPYMSTIKDLELLSKEYSEFLLKRSIDEYSKGFDTLEDMQAEIARLREVYKNSKYLNEKWYWQEVDRKNAQDRYISRLKIEAKTKSITYFTRAINTLDDVRSNELKNNDKVVDYKSKLFRIYVSTQYDIGNIKACIPILERYVTMSEDNRKDVWAWKYLSSCYGVMEAMLDKNHKTNEEDVIYFKNKKNQSTLTAVELQYGINSEEFKEVQKIVQLDERKREVINLQ